MNKTVRLILMQEDRLLRKISLSEGRIAIGRAAHNHIVIDHPGISGEHAVILLENGDACIEDLNSTNGTKVNGQPVHKHFLQDSDVIELARCSIRYAVEQVEEAPRLKFLSGAQRGEEIVLSKTLTTIGLSASGVAAIARREDGFYLTHIEGPCPTEVNGGPISARGRKLEHGDELRVTDTLFRFLAAA